MAVRLMGVAPPDRLGCALACAPDDACGRVQALCSAGLAVERTLGRLSGFALTPEGTAALDGALASEGMKGNESLTDLYERFCTLNQRFLKAASDWQVRRHGPIEAPNDHTDADYDQAVIDRLCEIHDRVRVLVSKMAELVPRLGTYTTRLDDCVRRICGGDLKAFTAALAESYHTVWFELHQDLILTLGVERDA